jgi:hypothetical protein
MEVFAMDSSKLNFGDYVNSQEYMTPDYSQLIQTYYTDVTYLVDLLAKLAGVYNVLINSADVLNRIALAKKNDIKDALERVDELGRMIDEITDLLNAQIIIYENYARLKGDFIVNKLPFSDIIKSDIEHHIKHEHHED